MTLAELQTQSIKDIKELKAKSGIPAITAVFDKGINALLEGNERPSKVLTRMSGHKALPLAVQLYLCHLASTAFAWEVVDIGLPRYNTSEVLQDGKEGKI